MASLMTRENDNSDTDGNNSEVDTRGEPDITSNIDNNSEQSYGGLNAKEELGKYFEYLKLDRIL
jgi:hypothetical protein